MWHKVIQMKTSNVSSHVWKHQTNFLIRARLVVLFVIFARVGICYFTLTLISLRASQINYIHTSVNLTIIGSDYSLSPVRRQAIYWRLEEKGYSKIWSAGWRQFCRASMCLGLNVKQVHPITISYYTATLTENRQLPGIYTHDCPGSCIFKTFHRYWS